MTNAAPAAKKVLWVEDDPFLHDIITQKLLEQKWEVLHAAEGEAALTIARKDHPDAIVLDILLPGIDGIEVLTELKADEKTKDIPVIIFSNIDERDRIEHATALGAAGFFVKAETDLETIIETIQRIMTPSGKASA